MSEVKRYKAHTLHEMEGGGWMKSAHPWIVVPVSNYDAAQSELSALREELASANNRLHDVATLCATVEQRLAAAEQRNSDTIANLELAASMMDDDERGNRFAEVCRLAIKSLKPTESGASE